MISLTSLGQQFYAQIGQTISTFEYKNSAGQELDNLNSKSYLNMRLGYRDVLNNENSLFLSVGLIYSGYGAIGSDRVLDNYYEWDVSYLGFEMGLSFRFLRLRDFSFFLEGTAASEFLIQGTQTINNQVFNLVGEEEFNSYNFFLRGGLMVSYPISRTANISASYNYGITKQLNKGNPDDGEQLNFNAHQVSLGFIINLPGCNCSY